MSVLAKLERRLVGSDTALIVGFALFVHALILVNDGVFFDGWLIHSALKNGELARVRRSFDESGLPIYYYLHRVFHGTGGVLGYRVWAFASYVVGALALDGVLKRVQLSAEGPYFARGERLLVVAVSLSYPGFFQSGAEIIVVPYAVLYASFLVATWLTLLRRSLVGPAALAARVASLALFALSFWLKSLVFFYGGVLGLLLLLAPRKPGETLVGAAMATARTHLDYVLLPVVFWVAAARLFPTSGAYHDYYAFQPIGMVPTFGFFFWAVLFEIPNVVVREALETPLPFVALALLLWALRTRIGASFGTERARPSRWLLLSALALLGLAALPYAAVGRFPSVHGWNTRHALLAAVPVGLVLVWISRLGRHEGTRPFAPIAVSCLAVVGFVAMTWSSYVGLIARWAKDRAVMAQLHDHEKARAYSVFWVRDEQPLGGEHDYRFYEWGSMFKTAWGGETHIGFDERSFAPTTIADQRRFLTREFNVSQVDFDGCAARLTIRPGPRAAGGELGLALRYVAYRYARRGALDAFLKDVSRVEVEPLAERSGAHCALDRAASAAPIKGSVAP